MANSARLSVRSDAPGESLFLLGNEAIARGAVEAGVQVAACYPGTPSTEIMETLVELAKDFDIYAEWSVNEKVAFEVALAASICGVRAATVMKHVGVNVAHDPLMTAGYIGARGGLVLVSADDPGQWSSQTEQDNRYIAEQAYIPVLEPSNAQEAKDMMRDAFELSERFGQPFMLRSETRIGHARGDVVLGEISKDKRQGNFEKNVQKLVAMPGNARRNRALMVERMAKIQEAVDSLPYNRLKLQKGARLGIIASGISYSYALEAVRWLKIESEVSCLKIGTPYPLPRNMVRELLSSVPVVVVMEELEPIIETHVKAIAQEAGIPVKIHGKDVVPLIGELSIRKAAEAIIKLTGVKPPIDFAAVDNLVKEVAPLLPVRPPTLCAGCPHRATFYAINKACERVKNETGLEPIRPGDIGCYAMGASYPLDADDTAICMGSGFDTANGLARVIKNPIIGHLGDSTFFHSGIPPMMNAVYNQTRMAMVVMDNLITAMTGFQPHPGTGRNANIDDVQPIKPEDIARASGVKYVEVIDPLDVSTSIDVLEKAIKFEGPSLVVSRHQCNIMEQRVKKSRGEQIVPYHVETDKCAANSLPFCTAACPLHIDVRKYVGLIGEGKYTEALKVIKEKLPFPAIMGRICSRPCESQCKRGEVDESVAIAALKRSAADYGEFEEADLAVPQERAEKVAIVGGGPAGVMAAYHLRKMGYKVTIFEASPVLGGMLAAGIPEYRLPRDILHNELAIINKLQVEVKLNTKVGRDVTLDVLKENYNAVFLAVGAQSAMKLNAAGEDLAGVYPGLDFLREVNNRQKPAVGKKVVVIGGGNVAVDVALSTLRLGVRDVKLVCLESREEMPAYKDEVAQAEEEGVSILNSWGVKRITGAGGKVTGIELKACTSVFDKDGRFNPSYDEGQIRSLEADTVIIAIGQASELAWLNSSQVKFGRTIDVHPVTYATSAAGIFAGGDVVTGPASVVDALSAGRSAAISIHKYINGESLELGREGEGTQSTPLKVQVEGVVKELRVGQPVLPASLRAENVREVVQGYSQSDAAKEAARCLACSCQTCIKDLGCPAIIITEKNEVSIDDSLCPGCGICAQICPQEAILKDGSK